MKSQALAINEEGKEHDTELEVEEALIELKRKQQELDKKLYALRLANTKD